LHVNSNFKFANKLMVRCILLAFKKSRLHYK